MLEDAVVVEFFSRVASGLFWNMVDSGLKKRESAKESVLHREIARLNAACRKKCFQDIYYEIVDDLKKTEPEAINLSTEALGVFVKEQILSEGKQWAYSLVRKAKEKWVFFRMRKRHLLPALHDGMQGDEDGMQTCERPPLWAFGWPRGGVHMFTSLHVACLARVA